MKTKNNTLLLMLLAGASFNLSATCVENTSSNNYCFKRGEIISVDKLNALQDKTEKTVLEFENKDKILEHNDKELEKKINQIGKKECKWTAWKAKPPLSISLSCEKGKYVNGIEFKHAQHAEWWREEVRVKCCDL